MKPTVAKIFALSVLCFPLSSQADPSDAVPQLSNVQIQYVETLPSVEEKGTPRGNIREAFKRFEPKAGDDKSVDQSNNSELSIKAAEKVAFENGYFEMPLPLFEALVRSFATYQIAAAPTFLSAVRTKDEVAKMRGDLAVKLKPLATPADFTMSLLPYRVAYQDADNAVIWIGVLMWDAKASKNIWTYYVSVPFGTGRKGFSAADGDRVASVLTAEMVRRGWITVGKASPASLETPK